MRIGLHTGEATERDRNYFGTEVNRAARLMSTAHGGQIVVSDTTKVLLRNRLALRPLGDHRLRGLGRRMTVHQVVADGLPSEFPPLRSLGSFAGNLPQQLSSFVGRDQLLADVADLVRSNRLVTLSGVGGVGKTRLALEVGAEMADEFPDGVWLVELAPVGDPSSVPAAIATALGITPQGDVELIDTVAEAVAGRRLLLLVDNCEHVLDAAGAAIRQILGRSGNAKVLATSREYLWVAGETLLTVSPLALDGGIASDAVTLFVERAGAARPGFGLYDTQTAAAVTEICETLDGLPLGIELAAARMATMSAVEVRDRLGDRFRLLKGSERRPERQQTLRLAVGWSYDLLSDDERELLRNASVFSGGFDLAGISSVVDDADDVDVLERLDSLVRKSLVVVDHAATRTRYGMFETIRQFAEEQLSATGGLERLRDRHAAYFAARGRGSLGALERARAGATPSTGWRSSSTTFVPRFAGACERGELEVATDVAAHAALMGFSVQLFETVGWAEELLPAATAADVRRLPRLYTAAGYACFVGRAEAAAANAHRATELETQPGYDSCEPGYATFIEALGEVYCGHLDRYVELTAHGGGAPRGGVAGIRDRRVRRRSPVGRSGRRGARIDRRGGRRGSRARQPVLDRLHAVDRRVGVLQGRRASAHCWPGTRASTSSESTASSSSRASSDATRRACTPREGEPEAALVTVRAGHRVVPAGGQRGAAHHHAGQRARAVRTRRPPRCRGDASRGHLPRAGELPPRARARRPRRPPHRATGRGEIEAAHVRRSDARSQRRRGLREGADRARPPGAHPPGCTTRSLPA